MLDALQTLLFSRHYIPHGHCYLWQPTLVWLHVVSDVLIMLAYYSIPVLLVYFIRQREDVPFRRIFVLFSAFILTCGTTHFMNVLTLWQPIYWLSGGVKLITALVSCYTAVELVPVLPQALALPNPRVLTEMNQRLETEIEERKRAEINLQQLNADLEARVQARTADLQAANQALARDMSDRKRLETRLRSSEQQMRAVLEAMNDVVLVCQVQDNQITNIQMAPIDLPESETAEGDFVTPTVQYLWNNPDAIRQMQQVLDTGATAEFEYSLERGSQTQWFTTSVSPMSEQTVLWVARDISDRKQAEDALRESEVRYRDIYNHTPVMLHSIDNQGKLISVSDYWLEKMDYQRHEVLGRRSTEFLTSESQQKARETYLPQFYDQGAIQNAAYQFVTKSGAVMDVLLSAIIERSPQDGMERSLAVIIDVTELKHIEQQLQETNVELVRSNRELEQFAYVASHDLKEPLRMVTSFTQLLAQTYSTQLDADAERMIGFAVDGANRMQQLIDDLLTYSRVGTQRNTLASLDCDTIVEAAKANLQIAITESGAVIHQQPLPTIVSDRLQLQQLWQNLLSNAIKYRSDRPLEIEIGVEDQDQQWCFFVRDNGIGLDPAYADRIFMIFQRLHTRQEYPGTGIGLAICSKIVDQLGGKIWVESARDRGSTFYFTLPKHPLH